MKKILATICICLLLWFLCLIPMVAFLIALKTLNLLPLSEMTLFLFCGLSAAVAILIMYFGIMPSKKLSKLLHPSKFKLWLERNSHNLVTGYILFILACVSVQDEVIFDSNSLNNLIVIQWMIFTISVAVFLVYWGSIKPYLIDIRPIQTDDSKGIKRINYLLDKKSFYSQIGDALSTIRLLTINLFVLIIATAISCFMIGANIYSQTVATFSFCLSVNSLCMIFNGIAVPISKEIKTMMKENEVSEEEYSETMLKGFIEEVILQTEDKHKSLSEEESFQNGDDNAK